MVFIGFVGMRYVSPKEDGGMGIRLIRSMNEALTTKWLWRFASEDEVLWKKVIVCKKYDSGRLGW